MLLYISYMAADSIPLRQQYESGMSQQIIYRMEIQIKMQLTWAILVIKWMFIHGLDSTTVLLYKPGINKITVPNKI